MMAATLLRADSYLRTRSPYGWPSPFNMLSYSCCLPADGQATLNTAGRVHSQCALTRDHVKDLVNEVLVLLMFVLT